MAENISETPGIPFLSKELRIVEGDKLGTLLVKVYAPIPDEALYRCTYEIWVGSHLALKSSATGGDTVHALLLALWKIETELKYKLPFNSMTIEHDVSLGFGFIHSKRVWDSVYK